MIKKCCRNDVAVFAKLSHVTSQGEIRRFRISEILRKPGSSSFRRISGGPFRRETRKSKIRSTFRVSAAFPLAEMWKAVSIAFPQTIFYGNLVASNFD